MEHHVWKKILVTECSSSGSVCSTWIWTQNVRAIRIPNLRKSSLFFFSFSSLCLFDKTINWKNTALQKGKSDFLKESVAYIPGNVVKKGMSNAKHQKNRFLSNTSPPLIALIICLKNTAFYSSFPDFGHQLPITATNHITRGITAYGFHFFLLLGKPHMLTASKILSADSFVTFKFIF